MKGGYVLVNGQGIDLANASSGSAAGLNARLATVLAGGKMVIMDGLKKGTATVPPVPAILTAGSGGVISAQIGTLTVAVTSANVYTVTDMIPVSSGGGGE